MLNAPWRFHIPIHLRREVVTLAMLTGLSVVLLIGVTALSQLYHAQQDSLADRWSARGAADLASGGDWTDRANGEKATGNTGAFDADSKNAAQAYKDAVNDYHTSLRYARDGYAQQLGLAEALIGLHHVEEARVYLVNLWAQQPENGIVNRELARIAAGKKDTRSAIRYYQNAIYANWPAEGTESDRVATRWELIKYLLGIHALAQAQSELISLGAEVGDNAQQQFQLGQYFLKVDDGEHALTAFRIALREDPHNAAALGGAGEAAFYLSDYPLAQHYLTLAVDKNPADSNSESLLEVTSEVLRLNPFRRQISDADRSQAILGAFDAAGDRLKSCPAIGNRPVAPGSQQTLSAAWNQLEPQMNLRELRRNHDVVNNVMNLGFNIEHQAAGGCGPGTPSDTALLLISKMREGS